MSKFNEISQNGPNENQFKATEIDFCGFKLAYTADGSPTLTSTSEPFESMHNRLGAAGETDYIYGAVVKWVFENCEEPNFLNVGLGLGYVELLIALYSKGRNYKLISLESNLELVSEFNKMFTNRKNAHFIYDEVIACLETATNSKLNPEDLTLLKGSLHHGGEIINWSSNKNNATRFNGIFFDPFSENTSPQIWTEEFVHQFLNEKCAESCAFATYAAKGKLNRSLRSLNFNLERRPGFAGKRQSTFAFRKV